MARCPRCGWSNVDEALECGNCRADLRAPHQPTQDEADYSHEQQGKPPYRPHPNPALDVPDNLAWSIIVTILCCWVFGIPAIVQACEANRKRMDGDYEGAMAAYKASVTWTNWSWATSVVLGVVYLFLKLGGLH